MSDKQNMYRKTFDHLQARFESEKDELIRLVVP